MYVGKVSLGVPMTLLNCWLCSTEIYSVRSIGKKPLTLAIKWPYSDFERLAFKHLYALANVQRVNLLSWNCINRPLWLMIWAYLSFAVIYVIGANLSEPHMVVVSGYPFVCCPFSVCLYIHVDVHVALLDCQTLQDGRTRPAMFCSSAMNCVLWTLNSRLLWTDVRNIV